MELDLQYEFSLTSLIVALNLGASNDFGKPIKVLIGPENKFRAREILAVPEALPGELNPKYRDRITYEVDYDLPQQSWRVVFEKGTVESKGPN